MPDVSQKPSSGSFFATHDLAVILCALVVLAVGLAFQSGSSRPRLKSFARDGLTVRFPASWLAEPGARGPSFRGEDALTRLEIFVSPRPQLAVGMEAALELARGQTYGSLYARTSTAHRAVKGREWLRTEYSYALKPADGHAPRVATAVEYAAESGERLYVVTLHGTDERVRALEPVILTSLEVKL
jgi:hypothetical protein